MRRLTWIAILVFAASAHAQMTTTAQQLAAAEKFGTDIAQAFNQRDRKALAMLIDFQRVMVRSADFQGLSGTDRESYLRGASKAGITPLLDNYFRVLDTAHGTVRYMRVTGTSPARSLVRFDMGAQGFNYLEYHLDTDAAGNTRAKDWYQLATGDLISVTLGGIAQLFANNSPGLIERLLGAKSDADTTAMFARIGQYQRAGKYAEALEVYKQLPEPIANSRLMLTLRASTANLANNPEEHDRALTTMAKLFANDPAASFMLIDYYYARKDAPELLRIISTVEKRVGVDGNTCMLRANAHALGKDFTNALKSADDAVRLEPDLLAAQDSRATILVQLTRYQDAVDAYRAMEKTFGLRFARANFSDPLFRQFVTSRPFSTWLPK